MQFVKLHFDLVVSAIVVKHIYTPGCFFVVFSALTLLTLLTLFPSRKASVTHMDKPTHKPISPPTKQKTAKAAEPRNFVGSMQSLCTQRSCVREAPDVYLRRKSLKRLLEVLRSCWRTIIQCRNGKTDICLDWKSRTLFSLWLNWCINSWSMRSINTLFCRSFLFLVFPLYSVHLSGADFYSLDLKNQLRISFLSHRHAHLNLCEDSHWHNSWTRKLSPQL